MYWYYVNDCWYIQICHIGIVLAEDLPGESASGSTTGDRKRLSKAGILTYLHETSVAEMDLRMKELELKKQELEVERRCLQFQEERDAEAAKERAVQSQAFLALLGRLAPNNS